MIKHKLSVFLLIFSVAVLNAQSIQEQLQEKLSEIQMRESLFGISAAVMVGNDTLWIGSAGYSDPFTKDTLSIDMNASIGSNTKMMTSAIILQLVKEGKLTLDDTIDKWIISSSKLSGNVTVQQLLNHTSGIADYTTEEWVDSFRVNPGRVWTFEAIVDVFVGPPDFQPGTSWKYSNTGYFILGKIIESIEGKSYREVLYERIINPLNLTTMYTPIDDKPTGPVMLPWFDIDDDGDQENLLNYSLMAMHTSGWAAGYVYSTPIDLARFLHGLFTNDLINGSRLAEMKTAVTARSSYDYGLGLVKYKIFDKPYYGHTGQYLGYLAFSAYEEESELSVAILLNLTYGDVYGIGKEITELAYNIITEVDQPEVIANDFKLSQNYPNPFNPSTIISYSIPQQNYVTLRVYDILGNEVQTLVSENQSSGSYEISFNASSLSSGIYFYSIQAGEFSEVRKMMLVK